MQERKELTIIRSLLSKSNSKSYGQCRKFYMYDFFICDDLWMVFLWQTYIKYITICDKIKNQNIITGLSKT